MKILAEEENFTAAAQLEYVWNELVDATHGGALLDFQQRLRGGIRR